MLPLLPAFVATALLHSLLLRPVNAVLSPTSKRRYRSQAHAGPTNSSQYMSRETVRDGADIAVRLCKGTVPAFPVRPPPGLAWTTTTARQTVTHSSPRGHCARPDTSASGAVPAVGRVAGFKLRES
ncbi:hypothetical protein HPB50_013109 [Hyalomma asiaticum]|uniref:Uncharacterized protein n=1 Tax=Hyalomma asiaticum TaxID=266040 RepID=A0ACB7SB42_HYAAI|nr:hypothetical protein HPB50_013109 [Hyalomma asiaticum]